MRGGLLAAAVLLAGWGWRAVARAGPIPFSQRVWLAMPRPQLSRERLRAALAPQPGEALLEIGPGPGYYTLDLAAKLPPASHLVALDLAPDLLHTLRHRAMAAGTLPLTLVRGDAQALPFGPGAFDAIVMAATLGEVPEPAAVLREARRVLKPGGRLLIGEAQPDPHLIPPDRLAALAAATGFRVVRQTGSRLGYLAHLAPANPGPAAR